MNKSGNMTSTEKSSPVSDFFRKLGSGIALIGTAFADGDWKTRISYLIMGFGELLRGQIAKGLGFLICEIGFIYYMIAFGGDYLSKLNTLGTVVTQKIRRKTVYGDNSFLILLFGVLSFLLLIFFIALWYLNIVENRNEELALRAGKKLPSNKKVLGSLLDENFHITLLALPVTGVLIFTVLPIIFMICVAFTNYDKDHQAPTNLFTWVGFDNFRQLVNLGSSNFSTTFLRVLAWTLIWALFATFIDYFIGLAVAILINKKGIKFKKLWRTILVMTIAVPQFVSLLYVAKLFATDGLLNGFLVRLGLVDRAINFWSNPMLARILIIAINVWIGIPYIMLIATGLLMNIPEDLYESARIDGATGWQQFRFITLPYMLFVTGPFLLTQYIGNLNNFNVIYLLSGGGPTSTRLAEKAGNTDLLVTWLYKMTVQDTNYKMAAVIGIMVFVVTAIISLVAYSKLPSVKDEEGFQ